MKKIIILLTFLITNNVHADVKKKLEEKDIKQIIVEENKKLPIMVGTSAQLYEMYIKNDSLNLKYINVDYNYSELIKSHKDYKFLKQQFESLNNMLKKSRIRSFCEDSFFYIIMNDGYSIKSNYYTIDNAFLFENKVEIKDCNYKK